MPKPQNVDNYEPLSGGQEEALTEP